MLLSLSISTNTNGTFPDQIEIKARTIEKLLKRDVRRRCLKQLGNKKAGAWKNKCMQAHGGETLRSGTTSSSNAKEPGRSARELDLAHFL